MTNRVVTPVNLKERIALLQQKAAGGSSSSQSSSSTPISPGTSTMPTSLSAASIPAGSSGSALRDRIAKFERKGGVPVPRGSFGFGAPPPPLEQTHEGAAARKKGELYGNRIASVSRHHTGTGSTSPPSMLRYHLTGNADVNAAASRSLISSSSANSGLGLHDLNPDDDSPSPMKVRSASTSSLATKRPVSTGDFPPTDLIMSGTFDEGESTIDGVTLHAPQSFIPNDSEDSPQSYSQSSRDSSISCADATLSHTSESSPTGASLSPGAASDKFASGSETDTSKFTMTVTVPELACEDHQQQKSGPEPRADSVAQPPTEVPPVSPPRQETEQKIEREEFEDESLVETPVVAAFSPSISGVLSAKEGAPTSPSDEHDVPSEDPALLPFSDSSKPLQASVELGERVYCETRMAVVIPPSGSVDATIGTILEQVGPQEGDAVGESNGLQESTVVNGPVAALGISGINESRESTETVNVNNILPSTETTERGTLTSQDTSSSSTRRHSPPAPLIIQHETYVEPSVDPKVGPKSFHVVVHRKTTEPARVDSSQTQETSVPRAPIVVTRARDSISGTPGSPDLSALLVQAMYLEQKLEKGDMDVSTPRPDEDAPRRAPATGIELDTNTASRQSDIAFPQSGCGNEARDEVPALPPKEFNARKGSQRTSFFSRKSSNRSSGIASSEDSVPVLTPSSPTMDLAPPAICEEPHQMSDESGKDEQSEPEGRQSISSTLSSPRRSARKKVLSIFGRVGRSGSTLALPDDLTFDLSYSSDSNHRSGSPSVSVCPSSVLLPSPVDDAIQPSSPISPNLRPRSKHDTPDVPRPVSVVSATSNTSAPSRLAVDLFDSFPDVPRSEPDSFEQKRSEPKGESEKAGGIEWRLEDVKEDPDEPYSPLPPTPPPKELDSRWMEKTAALAPGPQHERSPPPPPPKSPPPYSASASTLPSKDSILFPSSSSEPASSLLRKSKSKTNLRLPHIPYFSSSNTQGHRRGQSDASSLSSDMHASFPPSRFSQPSNSIFGSISRSFGGRRARSRKSSSASQISMNAAHGNTS